MKKWIGIAIALILVTGMLSACSTSKDSGSNKNSNKLVIYTPNSEDIINTVIPLFEKETGIKVEVVAAGAGELLKRVQSEKQNQYADILLGAVRNDYSMFEEYVSPNDQYMFESSRNTTGLATPYISNGSVLLVNKNLVGDIKIEGYEDLLNPALKGKISMADPASSSSAFAQLTNMLLAMGGDYTADAGWDYVAKLIKNLDGKIASGSSAAHKSVADGEYVVGLTYEDPSAAYVRDGAPVEIVYPKEGAVFLDSVVGIVEGAKNRENAEKFIDFIISSPAQDAFGTQLTNRPLRMDAKLGDHMKPMEDIYTLKEDDQYVGEHKAEIIERYVDLFTSLQ